MYSPNRANRILVVNGQVAQEGSQIAPGVVLEQIRVKSAVLVFRGYRYSLPF
jgi:general secretion pathway protein B